MVELRTLGALDLRRDDGSEIREVLVQPRRTALLVYLAVATPGGFVRRDLLRGLFWPDDDDGHARASLRTALSGLRTDLANGALVTRGDEEVGLDPDGLSCDVAVFRSAIERADFERAVTAYGGPFLSGFHLDHAAEFDQWVETERDRLSRAYGHTVEQLARAAAEREDAPAAVEWWQRLAVHDPYATGVALRVMEALERAGNRAGAIVHGEHHAARLREDLDAEPSPDVEALVAQLRLHPHPTAQARGPTARDPAEAMERVRVALADRYRIEREVGTGGMATVYLAEDRKHHRRVAVKVLRPELAAVVGGDRFLMEIQVTANLQHPNILPLYDSGESDTLLYYVMPYVEGETLRDKLKREKQLAVEETVEITKSVAAALSFAHEHGVIHRDIKPENILFQAGQPLVTDFGIALAVSEAGGTRLTETGHTIGTPQYMSPEQATGNPDLDARSDVYSLGAMVYEMLVGDPPHTGSSAKAIIARILSERPSPVAQSRDLVPPNVDAAVQKALAKNPVDRFASAEQFADAMTNPAFAPPAALPQMTGATGATGAPRGRGLWNRLTVILAVLTALFAGIALWDRLRPESPGQVSRVGVLLPDSVRVISAYNVKKLEIAPDGSWLVYHAENQLWIQPLAELTPTTIGPLGWHPFVSPDGRSVGSISGDSRGSFHLRTFSLDSRRGVILADSVSPWTADWGRDGMVYFWKRDGLRRVSAEGGEPEILTTVASTPGALSHRTVNVLPNNRGALFTLWYGSIDESEIAVLDLATKEIRPLVRGVTALYAATGHLLYVDAGGTLFAAPFDPIALEVSGPTTQLIEGIDVTNVGVAQFAISETGTLLYRAGGLRRARPVWVSRDGTATPIDPAWRVAFSRNPKVSPDGNRLALDVRARAGRASADNPSHIVVTDLDRGTDEQVTSEGWRNLVPFWSPDGRSLAFFSYNGIASTRADGSAGAQVLASGEGRQSAIGAGGFWSPDGRWIVVGTAFNIVAVRPGVDSTPSRLWATEAREGFPALSPNGRWLAYQSAARSGSVGAPPEVYVRPFPDVGESRERISNAGGTMPVWGPDGRELFFKAGGRMMIVDVQTDSTFVNGPPRELFEIAEEWVGAYDIHPDGRFVMMEEEEAEGGSGNLILVLNFFEELKAKVGN